MSATSARTGSPLRRRLAVGALAASLAVAGVGASTGTFGAHHDGGSSVVAMKKAQCWYKGWFKEDGVWYQGWFLESC